MDKPAAAGEPSDLGEVMPEDAGLGSSMARKRCSPEPIAMVCEGVDPVLVRSVDYQLGTPRGRYDEHNSKFSLSMKPRFNRPVGERNHF
jgi:hypothetical protein